jgi:hypothetical protein
MVEDPLPTPLPSDVMLQLLFGKQITYALAALARLGIADHMGNTPISVDALAKKAGAHAPSLYRVMRMLASAGVFTEADRQFALTPVGELLRTDHKHSARYRAMLRGDEWTTRAYEHFVDCIRNGTDGVTKAYGKNMFELLAERPDQADTFHRAMTDSSAISGQAILEVYDFSWIEKLADVGGGRGALLTGILREYPQMHGLLYDLPEVVATVPENQFVGCEDRVRIEAGDFLRRVPENCDAYILKHIIHNWADDECREILNLVRDQLPGNGLVLICEMIIESDSSPSPAKMLDIEMLMTTVGGKERTREEFRDLLASAGLCLIRVVPTSSAVCIIEASHNGRN